MVKAAGEFLGDEVFADEFAFAEIEVVWTALDEFVVDVAFVLGNAEVAGADALLPVRADLVGCFAMEISRVEGGYANFCDLARGALVCFYVDGDEDDVEVGGVRRWFGDVDRRD